MVIRPIRTLLTQAHPGDLPGGAPHVDDRWSPTRRVHTITLTSRVARLRINHSKQQHNLVGLYLNPPDKAIILSVDEKSQIQALDRTQPILPLRPGLPERRTHDCQRHGTTTLFAALNLLVGTVIGACLPKHRHQEFLRFLDRIDQSISSDLEVHLVFDNYGTRKYPALKQWLAFRPR